MSKTHIQFDYLSKLLESDESIPLELDNDAERHLESCGSCQEKMEHFVADEDWWTKASDFLNKDQLDTDWERETTKLDSFGLTEGNGGEESVSALLEAGKKIDSNDQRVAINKVTDDSILDAASHPEMLGRIDGYDVEGVIGRGGMGVVYKGYDTQLSRSVAIKVLSPHLAGNGIARKRFAREARAAAAVVHSNVIPIHGVNSDGKLPFIVMQLVAGQSLQAYVEQQGPLETKDIIRIALQIAAGLEAAHKQGLVHRDIKPANILMEHDVSRVMITDFGLARAADDAAMTQTGWLAGTPHYMSPEQAKGRSVNQASDLFSLGSVMYFMATGRVPFRANGPVAVLNLICNEEVTPVRQVNSDVPRPLSDLIEKLLEKQSADRFRSASQLHKSLENYLAYLQHPETIKAPRKLISRRQIRRRSIGLASAAAALLLFAILFRVLPMLGPQDKGPASNPGSPKEATLVTELMPIRQFHEHLNDLNNDLNAMERLLLGDSLNPPMNPSSEEEQESNRSENQSGARSREPDNTNSQPFSPQDSDGQSNHP